jgi:hypothetical protein
MHFLYTVLYTIHPWRLRLSAHPLYSKTVPYAAYPVMAA